MKTGLLWFDDDPRKTLAEKVQRAAAHYERKYGRPPDLCFVHPGVFGENGKRVIRVGRVEVRPGRSVLPHHFWLGEDEENGKTSLAKTSLASRPRHSLIRRVREAQAEDGLLTPERARQLVLALETEPPGQEARDGR